ncbi:hypothetical protein D3C80_2082980 [compost metagenome]
MPVISIAGMTEPRFSSYGDCCGTTRLGRYPRSLRSALKKFSLEDCPFGSTFCPPSSARNAAA